MTDYIDGVLGEVPSDIKVSAGTPTASYLFKVNKVDGIPLGAKQN